MHDIDRTRLEVEQDDLEADDMEFETGDDQEGEQYDFEDLESIMEDGEYEAEDDEADDMESAAELLQVRNNDEELEQFLGKLIQKAGRAVGKAVRSPVGRALGRVLKKAARQAIPIAGSAIGRRLGGATGARIGRDLASCGMKVFGLELEGVPVEDQEFELARRFVRLAKAAAKKASTAPAHVSPMKAAKVATISAARRFAPGLLRSGGGIRSDGKSRSGRWMRRGRRIILMGV